MPIKQNIPRILVDMSATIIHHGHIRLLKKANKLGDVIVALTTDDEIYKKKGYYPELKYSQRREILMAISYVSEVLPSNWLIDDEYLRENNIDYLVHGDDNSNSISEEKLIVYKRTSGVSSSLIRKRFLKNAVKHLL